MLSRIEVIGGRGALRVGAHTQTRLSKSYITRITEPAAHRMDTVVFSESGVQAHSVSDLHRWREQTRNLHAKQQE